MVLGKLNVKMLCLHILMVLSRGVLMRITLPLLSFQDTVTSISASVFYGCGSLQENLLRNLLQIFPVKRLQNIMLDLHGQDLV